jgi:hypothetical protein
MMRNNLRQYSTIQNLLFHIYYTKNEINLGFYIPKY